MSGKQALRRSSAYIYTSTNQSCCALLVLVVLVLLLPLAPGCTSTSTHAFNVVQRLEQTANFLFETSSARVEGVPHVGLKRRAAHHRECRAHERRKRQPQAIDPPLRIARRRVVHL